jgi:hypothetical protein
MAKYTAFEFLFREKLPAPDRTNSRLLFLPMNNRLTHNPEYEKHFYKDRYLPFSLIFHNRSFRPGNTMAGRR